MHDQTPGLNPFLPFGTYIPDGEPKVFGDRIYLYGSYDRFGQGYCSKEYHAVSAPLADLTDWTDHGVSFSTKAVPWSDADLYAPDALYRNGKYYLFFCLSDGTEGVAESASPEGPFTNARQITLNGKPITGIDPSVLEDGGRVYYTWGQFHLNMGELCDDLCSIRPESVHTDVLSNAPGREGFHEGSSLRKLGDRYCLIYASEYAQADPHNGARPTKLDYAVSDAVYGPYERRGTVIDNEGCDPASWNNHGSVISAGGAWYVFYHASSNNSAFSRRARAERLSVDVAAGFIGQAIPTTNGFLQTLRPEQITSPVHACRFFGGAYVTETPDGGFPCVGLRSGAGFSFSPALFDGEAYSLALRYRATEQFRVKILLDAVCVADESIPGSGEQSEFTVRLQPASGTAALRLEIADDGAGTCAIYAMKLSRAN
ncbi:MAG: family 43 glycosylhydrolase [Clostridia bacterium]|nr:family 43 glycosylhydrolase [Clostridia bacterium]